MAANNIIPFSPTDTGTNLLSDAQYAAASDRTSGNQPGVASSRLNNKALRQSSAVAAGLAQFIANNQATDISDSMTPTQMAAAIGAGILGRLLRISVYGTSGTFTPGPGTRFLLIEMIGGGGGGGGSGTTNASSVSAGCGGAAGSFLRHFLVNPVVQNFQVGAPGAGGGPGVGGGTGGATTFGSLVAPGGNGGALGNAAPPWLLIGGDPGNVATNGNLLNTQGQQGGQAFALAVGAFVSGAGAPSPYGGGGRALGTVTSAGFSSQSQGAGGGGAICGQSTGGQSGGQGGGGLITVHEFGGV